jgi:hypothetical protein
MKAQFKTSPNVFKVLFLALSIVLTSAGCVADVDSPTGIPHATSTLSPTISITPSPGSSQTAVPPTQTPMIPVPTLPPQEKERYLLDLIESNGGCELPCFLGIQPGVSMWEEIRRIEGPLYFRAQYLPYDKDSIYLYTYMEGRAENLEVGFKGSNKVIEQITVVARIYLPDDPYGYFPAFAETMHRYSLPNLLAEFGIPSRILLHVQGQAEPGAGTQASILLLYDKLGILADYWFLDSVTQDSETGALRACPNYEHTHSVSLYLQNPENNNPLERMIGGADDYALNHLLKPVQDVTTLSIEDFFNLFVEPDESDCFEVP